MKTLLNNVVLALLDGKIRRKNDWAVEFENGYVLNNYRWKDNLNTDAVCLANVLKKHKEVYNYVMNLYKSVKYNFKVTFYCDGKYKEERVSINGDFNTQIAWLDIAKQSVITASQNGMRLIKISLVNIEEE